MRTTYRLAELALLFSIATLCPGAGAEPAPAVPGDPGIQISELGGVLRVEIGGELFTEYHFRDVPRPYFYPVLGPGGVSVTRHWPMSLSEHEEQDHPHHRSLWYAHGEVNGRDFWSENEGAGKIVHDEFLQMSSGPENGVIRCRNRWVAPDGRSVCSDTRTYRFYRCGQGQLMDFDVTIHASQGDVVLGDTKEGSLAIRLAPTMRLKGEVAGGHIVNSEGVRDGETWGRRAAWCDYHGPVGGQVVGVAIFDHPRNPRHPTWWHVRDYGLFAANPFGMHFFENRPEGTGNMSIARGQSLTFRYRLYFHRGDEKQGKVAECYLDYVETPLSEE